MSDMIERVALKIALHCYGGYPVDKIMREQWPTWSKCIECASAAVEAMREPTDAMEYAGATVADNIANVEAEMCWRAMIDAALSKANPPSTPPEGREQNT